MPRVTLKPSAPKPAPEDNMEIKETPIQFPLVEEIPVEMPKIEETPAEAALLEGTPAGAVLLEETPAESPIVEVIPEQSKEKEELPEPSKEKEELPEPSKEKTTMPSDFNERNCITVNGVKREIKPTKLNYFRNKAASGYGAIKVVPIQELLTYGKGMLDAERDADQLLYDFLVSVFDDPGFVRENYDNMDAEHVEQAVHIFGRLNHIDEKEELARKNKEAQAQAKR